MVLSKVRLPDTGCVVSNMSLLQNNALKNLSDLLVDYQIAAEHLLQHFETPAVQILDDADRLIGRNRFIKILQLCALETGDPLFAFKLGLRTRITDMGPAGEYAAGKPTLGLAMRSLVKHFAVFRDEASVTLDPADDGEVRLSYHIAQPVAGLMECDVDFTIGMSLRLIRDAAGENWRPRALHLAYAAVGHKATYERFAGGPIFFDQSANGVICDISVLSLPMPDTDRSISLALGAYIAGLEADAAHKDDLIARLRLLIVSNLSSGHVTLADIAKDCALSPRTLQRRLALSGTVFENLVTETRRAVAERLLAASALSTSDIGARCGYSDPTNFHRAFLRWTGITPAQFRRRALSAPLKPQVSEPLRSLRSEPSGSRARH